MVVVDTNILAYLLLEGDRTKQAQALFAKDSDWRSEAFLLVEFSNILATYNRMHALSTQQTESLLIEAAGRVRLRKRSPRDRKAVRGGGGERPPARLLVGEYGGLKRKRGRILDPGGDGVLGNGRIALVQAQQGARGFVPVRAAGARCRAHRFETPGFAPVAIRLREQRKQYAAHTVEVGEMEMDRARRFALDQARQRGQAVGQVVAHRARQHLGAPARKRSDEIRPCGAEQGLGHRFPEFVQDQRLRLLLGHALEPRLRVCCEAVA